MDKEYEALLENYEDAMMRLVMYRVAQEDGKQLLEEAEQLEASGFEVPKEFDEKCLKLIREASVSKGQKPIQLLNESHRNKTRTRSHPRLRMVGRMALAAVLAATLLFTAAYAASPEFRANVLNFFLDIRENGTFFFFNSGNIEDSFPDISNPLVIKNGMPFEFTYIPDGYELFMQEVRDEGIGLDYICVYANPNDDPNNFSFEIEPLSENAGLLVDTEDAQVTEMKIKGYDGYCIEKTHSISGRKRVMYLWFDLENHLSYFYDSIGVSTEENEKIFNGIVIYD